MQSPSTDSLIGSPSRRVSPKITRDRNELDYIICDTGYTGRLIEKLCYTKIETIKERIMIDDMENKVTVPGIYKVRQPKKFKKKNYKKIIENPETPSFEHFRYMKKKDLNKFFDSIMFINDDVWGKGLYKIGSDEEVDHIMNVLKTSHTDISGIICFKCPNRKDMKFFIEAIQSLNYCQFCAYEGDEYIPNSTNDTIITVLSWDTESG